MNFGDETMRSGVRRIVNHFAEGTNGDLRLGGAGPS
jgi:hypothetical protein